MAELTQSISAQLHYHNVTPCIFPMQVSVTRLNPFLESMVIAFEVPFKSVAIILPYASYYQYPFFIHGYGQFKLSLDESILGMQWMWEPWGSPGRNLFVCPIRN